jgi:hypothetical protein
LAPQYFVSGNGLHHYWAIVLFHPQSDRPKCDFWYSDLSDINDTELDPGIILCEGEQLSGLYVFGQFE